MQPSVDFRRILEKFSADVVAAKVSPAAGGIRWYPYDSLANMSHLERLLGSDFDAFSQSFFGKRILDIGPADGDLAFLFERLGASVDAIDLGSTNMNHLQGMRHLTDVLRSNVRLIELDLDTQFSLPEQSYDFAIVLGILYHIKNPFYFMSTLAKHVRSCVLSTKIARRTPDGLPLSGSTAYLVDSTECNGDETNYWIFSEAGLRRLLSRTGWEIRSFMSVGDVSGNSDPSHADRDERAFCHLVRP